MLFRSLEFLREQTDTYLKSFASDLQGVPLPYVKLANIAKMDEQEIKNADNVFISLVNIAEETTLRNLPHYSKEFPNTVYRNPPVYLNLFVLFSAILKSYDHSLIALSHIVRFFQAKTTFTPKNSVITSNSLKDFTDFHIIMDLYSPTFEQANYLWSTLGGKQHPFILYKVRLTEMQREGTSEVRGIIKEIEISENLSPKTT